MDDAPAAHCMSAAEEEESLETLFGRKFCPAGFKVSQAGLYRNATETRHMTETFFLLGHRRRKRIIHVQLPRFNSENFRSWRKTKICIKLPAPLLLATEPYRTLRTSVKYVVATTTGVHDRGDDAFVLFLQIGGCLATCRRARISGLQWSIQR